LADRDPCRRKRPEVALLVGRAVRCDTGRRAARDAIIAASVALEVVDVRRPPSDLEGIVADNCFHRAFVLGEAAGLYPLGLAASLTVNGERRGAATAAQDYPGLVQAAARLLASVGERLGEGDILLAGSLTRAAIQPGDTVMAEVERLGALTLAVA
jgi:2-keto-4-pentenoate hydratase